MNETLTELVFILDRSGSMHGLEGDTIGGFNSMLAKQKAMPGDALVTTVLFSDDIELLHDLVAIGRVSPLTEREYLAGGCTALLDAIGRTLDRLERAHCRMETDERPARTVVVITTDGLENASRAYGRNQIRQLVSQKQEKDGWEFLFLGANMDAIATAAEIGIRAAHAAQFVCDSAGTQTHYEAVNGALERLRCHMPLSAAWKAPIEADTQRRAKRP